MTTMKTFGGIIFSSFFIFQCHSVSSSFPNQITSDLIYEFSIHHCIIVSNEKINSETKQFSIENIPTIRLDYDELIDFVNRTDYVNCRIGIIFREENLLQLERISEIFKQNLEKSNTFENIQISRIYQMCNFIWLIFLDSVQPIQHDNLKIPYQCEFYVIKRGNASFYEINEIYSVKDNAFLLYLGVWDNGLKMTNVSMYHRRMNLNGTEMYNVYLQTMPCNEKMPVMMVCFIEEIIDDFATMMNFQNRRINLRATNMNNWILYSSYGDIKSTPAAIMPEDDFRNRIGPIFKEIYNWYIKKPSGELRPDFYLQPFHLNIWLVTIPGIITIGAVLIIIIQYLIPSSKKEKRSFTDNIFIGVEILCNQNGNDNINNDSSRIVCLALNIIAIVIVNSFEAVITSYLTVETFDQPFRNIEEFIDDGSYKLLMSVPGNVNYWLTVAESTLLEKFYQNYTIKVNIAESIDRRKEVCYKNIALNGKENQIYYYNDIACALFKIPQPLVTLFMGFYIRERSELYKVLNHNVIRLYEYGIQKRMQNILSKGGVETIEDDAFHPIEIVQMKQILSMPLFGLSLAIVILIGEFICKVMKVF